MAFWHNFDTDVRRAGRINYDVNIDEHIAAEKRAAEGIKAAFHMSARDFQEIKRAKHYFKKAIRVLEWAAREKTRVEEDYDYRIAVARREGHMDEERALKHQKYRIMSKISVWTYKKLRRILGKLSSLPHFESQFAHVNQQIERELEALTSGVRQEYREERVESGGW